jgi:hypothetical protein
MKTSTFELLNVRVLFLALSVFVVGCNKDEFYEKDFLEDPYQPDEQVDGGVTGATVGGSTDGSSTGGTTDGSSTGGSTTGSTVGGTTGATDGSTVGGTTGSTTGSTDGSSTGGSSTGSTVGGTTGGTDGSTVGGTTGSTTGSTDGSSTGGSTTGSTVGGTTGSTDGSSTGGSTTGSTVGGTTGSTDGTSTGGSTTGATDGGSTGGTTGSTTGVTHQWADESFNQTAGSQKKLDIIWVIDNSGSMAEEQANLGRSFSDFIDGFIDENVDFKMGVTTTDTRSSGGGQAVSTSLADLTSAEAAADEADFKSDFIRHVNVGIRGDGREKGLQASESFINRYKTSWMRDDAYLVVVYLSDEQDQSPKTKEEYLASLRAAKVNDGYVKAYSIVNTLNNCPSNITCGFDRYAYQSEQTGGSVADVTNNFSTVLSDMSQQIINLLDSFPLAHDPIVGSIEVRVNGVVQASGWSVTGRQLKFDAGSVPAVGASVQVRYQY